MNDLRFSPETISWLLLERYQLEEVTAQERATVERALAQNASLRRRLATIESDVRVLPPLPTPLPITAPRTAASKPRRWTWALAPLLATAAAILFVVLRPSPEMHPGVAPRASQVQIKGGTLALTLLRESKGVIHHAPMHFSPADRFKVLLTCPPAGPSTWEVVVFQGGEAFFPLPGQQKTRCGNRVALPGAFSLDGRQKVRVCVMIGASLPTRHALRERGLAALPAASVCSALLSPRGRE